MLQNTENKALPRGTTDTLTGAPQRRLMDFHQAGAYLNLSYSSVQGLVLRGLLPEIKIPCVRSADGRVMRRKLVDVRDLDLFIEQHKECGL